MLSAIFRGIDYEGTFGDRYKNRDNICFLSSGSNIFVKAIHKFKTIEEITLYFKEHPTEFIYALEKPEEINLTSAELESYKALTTCTGTTIIENNQDCYMQVSAGSADALRAKKLALLLGD